MQSLLYRLVLLSLLCLATPFDAIGSPIEVVTTSGDIRRDEVEARRLFATVLDSRLPDFVDPSPWIPPARPTIVSTVGGVDTVPYRSGLNDLIEGLLPGQGLVTSPAAPRGSSTSSPVVQVPEFSTITFVVIGLAGLLLGRRQSLTR
jgi:hypothetical protein